ncbi:MAG: DUF4396 domain-containing protein [Pseudomonadota bacterium]|nr:DUF4396 domain-containing protein [Pseudomonadota bacterium]
MIPTWLNLLAWLSLLLGLLSAIAILIDLQKRPQHMAIMHWVWPLCALFGHLLLLAFYLCYGRAHPPSHHEHHEHHEHQQPAPSWVQVATGSLHCGSGCTLGDIVAETAVLFFPAIATAFGWKTLFAEPIFAVWILDFIFAFAIGIVFQYFAIKPMAPGLSVGAALSKALKADALSLCAWQLGMYGFMALAHFYLFPQLLGTALKTGSAPFWLMMQLAMLCGLLTAFPVNRWLIQKGIKEAM